MRKITWWREMDNTKILRILLRLPNWLGDAVMVSPSFELLKTHFPNATFDIIGTKASCGIFGRDLRVNNIFIDSTKISQNGNKNGLKNRIIATKIFANEIAMKGEIDISIDFTNHFFSALLLYFTRSKTRIAYAKNGRGILLNKKIKYKKNIHQVSSYLNLVNEICGKKLIESSDDKNILLESNPLHLINKPIKAFKKDNKPCIGINPGAAYGSAKRWEEKYFMEIILYFLESGYRVFVFGNEALDLPQIITQNANFINLINKTSILDLMDYIALMDIFISNDSGPMHLSAAFGVPLIAIFGATDSKETSPWCKNAVILNKHLPCSPCKKRECPLKHHNCMKLITPDEVIECVHKML